MEIPPMSMNSTEYATLFGLRESYYELKRKPIKSNEECVVQDWLEKKMEKLQKKCK